VRDHDFFLSVIIGNLAVEGTTTQNCTLIVRTGADNLAVLGALRHHHDGAAAVGEGDKNGKESH
jgi:hypothetical protein